MHILDILRARLQALLDERNAAQVELDGILAGVAAENRSDLTADEAHRFGEVRTAIETVDVTIDETRQRIDGIEASQAAAARAEEMSAELAARSGRPVGGAVVTGEPATYRADNAGEVSILRDLLSRGNDFDAAERIQRHARETGPERRASTTANFAGLVVPQYLTDMVALTATAGRPTADLVRNLTLPADGMTVNISRITTSAAAGIQASENTAVSTQDVDDTLLTVNVRTIGGYVDESRQALERGTNVDQIVLAELAAQYAVTLDAQILSGAGTSGTHLGILNTVGVSDTDYTDASPTVAELWPKLANAVQKVNSTRFLPAEVIVMHPRRWGWLTAALDTGSRPLIATSGAPFNPAGLGAVAGYGAAVGSIMGLPVVTDANVPTNLGAGTNEDPIIIMRASDCLLWEESGSPMRIRLDEPGGHTLTVRFVLFGYSAFTAGRYPAAISTVTDTGLVTPTF